MHSDYDIRKVALMPDQVNALTECFTALRQGGIKPFLTLVERFGYDMGNEIARRAMIMVECAKADQDRKTAA